jgi:Tol biopolymer transport system component
VDDIFVRDRNTSSYSRISEDTGGGDANAASTDPAISLDGSTVVFTSSASDLVAGDSNGVDDIFKRDSSASTATTRVSVTSTGVETTTGAHSLPSVSSDGRYVGFVSAATDMVPNDTNGVDDVFVRDTQGTNADIARISVTAAGAQAGDTSGNARISDNGRYVSFDSEAALDPADTNGTNIDDVYRGHNASYP